MESNFAYQDSFVRGMRTGLYMTQPFPRGEKARKPTPLQLSIPTNSVDAGDPTITFAVENGEVGVTYLLPAGTILDFEDAESVIVMEDVTFTGNTSADVTVNRRFLEGAPAIPGSGVDSTVFTSWHGYMRVLGTDSSALSIGETTSELNSITYDSLESLTWRETHVTGKSWDLERGGRFRPNDPAYQAIRTAALQGREVHVLRILADEDGNPAEFERGRALVNGFNKPAPADGIVDASWTFAGQGPLEIASYADLV